MRKLLIICVVCIGLGFLAGFIVAGKFAYAPMGTTLTTNNKLSPEATEFHANGYKLISPLYECNTGQAYGQEQLTQIQSTIANYVDGLVKANSTLMASVYFRDLNNGHWFGVNEKESFAPSSLLKTPVMMAYYKLAQSQPEILEKKVKYVEDPPGLIPQNFPPENPLVKGKTYTIEELIEHMISDSDNVALWYLMQNIDNDLIDKVTLDLQIPTATDSTPDNFMNVQQYSTLFRILYNSTYLNDTYSEKSLEILSKSNFDNGLVKLLPQNLNVAHKFGERDINNSVYQLHDCGVVYYPNQPYLICVMTRGPDFNDLETTIQQISKKVYDLYSQKYH